MVIQCNRDSYRIYQTLQKPVKSIKLSLIGRYQYLMTFDKMLYYEKLVSFLWSLSTSVVAVLMTMVLMSRVQQDKKLTAIPLNC